MSYRKLLVDNLTCNRRFHISYDDEAPPLAEAQAKCLHCGEVIFARSQHPAVKLARDEILVKTTELSPLRTKACQFSDAYSPPPQPKL